MTRAAALVALAACWTASDPKLGPLSNQANASKSCPDKIVGMVVDDSPRHDPAPGATLVLSNAAGNHGAVVTGEDGKFSFSVVALPAKLTIYYADRTVESAVAPCQKPMRIQVRF